MYAAKDLKKSWYIIYILIEPLKSTVFNGLLTRNFVYFVDKFVDGDHDFIKI